MSTQTIQLNSGFRSGGSVRAVLGNFPNFEIVSLAKANANTWHDDGDSSCEIEIDDNESRPIFESRFWAVSSMSYEGDAKPLNAAARMLCKTPLPKGWAVTLRGTQVGGGSSPDTFQTIGTLERYICDLVADRYPYTHSPLERKESYRLKRKKYIDIWEAAGLNGIFIWDAHLSWSREYDVIQLANKLANRFMGHSKGHNDFKKLNGFSSLLSFPRTTIAEKMASLTCQIR